MEQGSYETWMPSSRCYTEPPDPNMFHNKDTEQEAKAFCLGCVTRSQCLVWALESDQWGVAGGLNRRERKALKKRQDTEFLKLQKRMKALSLDGKKLPNAS